MDKKSPCQNLFYSSFSASHRSFDSDLEMGKYHAVEDAMHEEVDLYPPRTAEPPALPSEYSLSTRSK